MQHHFISVGTYISIQLIKKNIPNQTTIQSELERKLWTWLCVIEFLCSSRVWSSWLSTHQLLLFNFSSGFLQSAVSDSVLWVQPNWWCEKTVYVCVLGLSRVTWDKEERGGMFFFQSSIHKYFYLFTKMTSQV